MNLVYRYWLCEANDGSCAAVYLFRDSSGNWFARAPGVGSAGSVSSELASTDATLRWIKAGRPRAAKEGVTLPANYRYATSEEQARWLDNRTVEPLIRQTLMAYGFRIKPG